MKTAPITNNGPAFKGYDARKLKSIAMTTNRGGIAQEMKTICNSYGVKVLLAAPDGLLSDKFEKIHEGRPYTLPWAQDIANVTPDKKVYYPWLNDGLGWLLHTYEKLSGILTQKHISGGNFFLIKNGESNDIIVGTNEIIKKRRTSKFFEDMFNTKNIFCIYQPDYHIDLGIRPLNNKNIIVGDDDLMIEKIQQVLKNIKTEKQFRNLYKNLKLVLDDFIISKKLNPYTPTEFVIKQIKEMGFNPIRVPGRLYSVERKYENKIGLRYDLNFVNAVAFETQNKDIVYITNKSVADDILDITPEVEKQINFSFKKIFKDSIKPYVKEENLYFVSEKTDVMDDYLSNKDAGIHCLCAEVPE